LKAERRSLLDVLDDLAVEHGLHAGDQLSLRVAELAEIDTMMAQLRASLPSELDGTTVVAQDLAPRTDAVVLQGDGVRVVVRPSGTEAKLKCYLEVVVPVASREELPAARTDAAERLTRVREQVRSALGA